MFFIALLSILSGFCPNIAHAILARGYDLDQNVISVPTKVILFRKDNGKKLIITQPEFEMHRPNIGHTGPYKDYEIRLDKKTGSFFYADSSHRVNYMLREVRHAVKYLPPEQWQEAMWPHYTYDMSYVLGAKLTYIVTARGTPPRRIQNSLKVFQEAGFHKHVASHKNIYPIAHKSITLGRPIESMEDIARLKAEAVHSILNPLQARPLDLILPSITTPDAMSKRPMHLWPFSDDKYSNIQGIGEAVAQAMRTENPWPNVKVVLLFTGRENPHNRPRALVPTPDGDFRPAAPEELAEIELTALEQKRCERYLSR